jgi:hypothetical protein
MAGDRSGGKEVDADRTQLFQRLRRLLDFATGGLIRPPVSS